MMNRILFVTPLMWLLGAGSTAAQTTATPSDSVVLRELLQIEADIAKANRECDYNYFRLIEADEFIFTDANGTVTTRAEDLAGEKDCRKSDYRSVVDEPRLLRYGDVAVLSARSNTFFTNREGREVVRRSRFTDVFVKRQGRWQLVSGHSSRIPETANR